MKIITNIKQPDLYEILCPNAKPENFKEIKAAVAYCNDYKLFEYCKKQNIKLEYFGRLDSSINLDLKELKSFLSKDISVSIIGGDHFHPKIIWCVSYGVYIGSANLTKSAWNKNNKNNIECGLWFDQKEIKDNHLIDSLDDFFKFIQKNTKAKSLKDISDRDISKIKKLSKKQTQNNPSNSLSIIFPNDYFHGLSKGNSLKSNSQTPKKRQTQKSKKHQPDCFFTELKEELKEELEKRGELNMSKPLGSHRKCILISLKPIGYKNEIRAYRSGKYPSHRIGVYYGFKKKDKKYYNKLKKGEMSHLIKKGVFDTEGIESWDLAFLSYSEGTTKAADKKWITKKIIALLQALKIEKKD